MKSIKLTYFDIQGVAEKVRLALVLGGIPFADVRVPFDQWVAIKPTTPYGQLPTMSIDGAEPIAQSEAMLRYAGQLATENGVPLYPADKLLAIEEARGLVSDLEREWRVPGGIGLQDPPALATRPTSRARLSIVPSSRRCAKNSWQRSCQNL